jgi:hypothetical protein
MCQECVADGHMTQAELDARIAAGDRNVIPIHELPLQEFLDALSEMGAKAMVRGMPRAEVLRISREQVDSYAIWREREGRPVTDAEVSALRPADISVVAQWN